MTSPKQNEKNIDEAMQAQYDEWKYAKHYRCFYSFVSLSIAVAIAVDF
jgi:hypothetical protein